MEVFEKEMGWDLRPPDDDYPMRLGINWEPQMNLCPLAAIFSQRMRMRGDFMMWSWKTMNQTLN